MTTLPIFALLQTRRPNQPLLHVNGIDNPPFLHPIDMHQAAILTGHIQIIVGKIVIVQIEGVPIIVTGTNAKILGGTRASE